MSSSRLQVKHIKIPPKFRGVQTYLESDIAVLHLTTPFVYDAFVRPVCLDFDLGSDRRQLASGNLATISAWGLSAENIKSSQVQIIKCRMWTSPRATMRSLPLHAVHNLGQNMRWIP
ncbi:Limulus clotting factor C [Eumeta japonica]|uniref:Limulus clotting factor C n=1 Tax=Eumeta variegata TaxID=151549 RepID=A0A4C1ZTB1_EUMVA|nr:Limulus clotting factor C [Eumeta japonica]